MKLLDLALRILGWFTIQRRQPRIVLPPPPVAHHRPRRIRAKRTRSILDRYRPQTWSQACYQFAWEHEGLHAWATIGRVKVRQAVVEKCPNGGLYLTIEHDLEHADRWEGWEGWWLSAGGKVMEHWSGRRVEPGAQQPEKEE